MGYDDKTDCLHQKITQLFGDLAFYLWGVSLVIAIGLTLRSVANSHFDTHVLWLLAGSGLAACLWQFGAGKIAGRYFNDYACHLGGLHLPFAGNFHRAQQLHTFSKYRQLVAAVAKRNRTLVKNKENRLCNTEL